MARNNRPGQLEPLEPAIVYYCTALAERLPKMKYIIINHHAVKQGI